MDYELAKYQPAAMSSFLSVTWKSAKDYIIEDKLGNRYIDFTSGIFVANTGHSNEQVIKAVRDVLEDQILFTFNYSDEWRKLEYLKKLTKWTGFEKAILLSTGAEAVEGAVRLMELHNPSALGICSLSGAYHGETWAARALGKKKESVLFPHIANINDFQFWINKLGIAGIVIETYEGWSGKFHDKQFIQEIVLIAQLNNILVCFDEIQAGFGRTGKKFGYEHYDVEPDLICCAKGMGSGFTLSAVLGKAKILDLIEDGDIWSTFSANPIACAAGLATINEFERLDLIRQAEEKGEILHKELNQIAGLEVYGKGMMAGLMFKSTRAANNIVLNCAKRGLLVVHTGKRSVKIGPPLTIPIKEMLRGIEILKEVICF
jgi:4-aminobutyrate aminotransferase-like enzyme